MKKNVSLGNFSAVLSISLLTFLTALGFWLIYQDAGWPAWIILAITYLLGLSSLAFTPMSLSLSGENLSIHRSLKIKDIPLSEISAVKLQSPSKSALRIFGSGGFFGYWGWFAEPGIGKYFAYYGKPSDCFLVTQKNGKKYMLGCKDATEMVAAIQEKLK